MDLTVVDSGVDGPHPEREALWNGVEAAVAEGVATEQTPSRKQDAAGDPETGDRLGGVVRAAGLVTTTAGEGG
jgi:hypothetical protein